MKFFKIILVFILHVYRPGICFGADAQIDSLKKLLFTSEKEMHVNYLNMISKAYIYQQRDSCMLYASRAFNEAKNLNYAQGMGDALFSMGKTQSNFSTREKYFLQAIPYYQASHNTDTLGQVYFQLGKALSAKADFKGSLASFTKAEQLYLQAKDSMNRGVTFTFAGLACAKSGDYEKAFEYGFMALQERQKNNEHYGVLWSLCNLASLFQEVEDYHTAIDYYYDKCVDYANKNHIQWTVYNDQIAKCYWGMHQDDSALLFMRRYLSQIYSDTILNGPLLQNEMTDFNVGLWYLMRNEYDGAIQIFSGLIKTNEAADDRMSQMDVLSYLGQTYFKKGNYSSALSCGRKLFDMATATGTPRYMRNSAELLWKVYDHEKSIDSAYKYHQAFISLRDSVTNYRFISSMTSFKATAEREKRELEYKQELEKQSLIKKILIGFIFIVILLPAIIFWNLSLKRKNEKLKRERLENKLNLELMESEKKQAALQNKTVELEMQALRAQMNPHFIFNSLNSINRFIMQNNRGQASQYLTKFSRLVRLILQNSQAELITIESELESLELYLDLEALRFNYHFGYKISIPKDMDISVLKVPPLIIQPYVENAIWHGLMHKEEKGSLEIELYEDNNFIFFKITDNGIGRKQASALTSKSATKHKSMGLRITADRIAMLYRSHATESGVVINDLVNPDGTAAGTEVIIKIPAIYD